MKKVPNHKNYYASKDGKVFRSDKSEITPFKSNKYLQVFMKDDSGKRHVYGVHQVIAMTFLKGYFKGCVVHHINEDTHDNNVSNLEIHTRSSHASYHADSSTIVAYVRTNGPANKGKKMSAEFCERCRQSALKRGFNGNQYTKKKNTGS